MVPHDFSHCSHKMFEVATRRTWWLVGATAAALLSQPVAEAAGPPPTVVLGLDSIGSLLSSGVPFPHFWRTSVVGASMGTLGSVPVNGTLARALPRIHRPTSTAPTTTAAAAAAVVPFTTRISRVRLLGGWKGGGASGDCVTVARSSAFPDGFDFSADWGCLDARVDPIVGLGLSMVAVFDNVPWAFITNRTGATGAYGNAAGPAGPLKPVFARYIAALMAHIVAKHGAATARGWQYRVATEPNCECHWVSGPDEYLELYDVITDAVATALSGPPAATGAVLLGPGNFAHGMNAGFVDAVVARLANGSATKHRPTVLGMSFYGQAPEGYRHADMASAIEWIAGYRVKHPALAQARVEIMEYGTLTNGQGHGQRSNEPSAFGAAWTAGGWVVGLAKAVDELYHWHPLDSVGGANDTLLFGWGWLLALGELLVGASTKVLTTTLPFSSERNATAVVGLVSYDPTTEAVYAVVTAFSGQCYNSSSTMAETRSMELVLPRSAAPEVFGAGGIGFAVDEWALRTSNSWYDVMWQDLASQGLLRRKGDPFTYKVKDMASDTGQAYVAQHFSRYNTMQLDALRPAAFDGVVGTNATHLWVSFNDSCPAVRIIRFQRKGNPLGVVAGAPSTGPPAPPAGPDDSHRSVQSNITYGQGLVCPAGVAACQWGQTQKHRSGYVPKDLLLDFYAANASAPAAAARGALIVVHGGAYWTGRKTDAMVVARCLYFASKGLAVFSIDYRLTGDQGNVPAGWPNTNHDNMTWIPPYAYPAVRDTKAAVRYVRANAKRYGVDADKIAMFGESAGACSAMAVAMTFESDYKAEVSTEDDPTLSTTNPGSSSRVAYNDFDIIFLRSSPLAPANAA